MADALDLGMEVYRQKWQRQEQQRLNDQSRDYNDKMFNLENLRRVEQWQRENAYNHPKQQMERLRQAGLNPNLVYGKGAENTAGSLSMASSKGDPANNVPVSHAMPNTGNKILEFAQLRQIQAQTDQVNQVTQNLKVDNALKALGVTAKTIGNEGLLVDTEVKKRTQQAAIDSIWSNAELKQQESAKSYYDLKHNYEKFEDRGNGKGFQSNFENKSDTILENLRMDNKLKKTIMANHELQQEMIKLDYDLKQMGLDGNDPFYIKSMIKLVHQYSKYE